MFKQMDRAMYWPLLSTLSLATFICMAGPIAPSAQALSPEVKEYIEQDIARNLPEINSLKDKYYAYLNCLAVAYLKLQDYPKAIATLQEVVVAYPLEGVFATNLSFAYLLNHQLDQAEAQAKQILSLPERSEDHELLTQGAYLLLGMVAEQRGQHVDAQKSYQQACQLNDESVCTYLKQQPDGKGYFAHFMTAYNARLEIQLNKAKASQASEFDNID